ncbi:MAG: OmpA family protein [Thermonemataceae bacterium]|nr:OmpA family protein [Thermonemataceae bacterium]
MKKIFLTIIFSLLCFGISAQKRLLKEADMHYEYEEYNLAIPLYESFLENEANASPTQILEVRYKLGISHLMTSQRGKALPYLAEVYAQNPKLHKNLSFYLAQSYQLQHQWDKAITYYKIAQTESEFANEIPKLLQECEFGKQYTKNPLRASIENLGDGINSTHAEYVPVLTEDEKILMFTSRRPSTTGGGKDTDQEFFEDIYIAEKTPEGWSQPQNMPRPINSNSHDACIALSPDGKTLFVYKTGSGKNKMGDIYFSEKTPTGWTDPKSIGDKINTKYREPSVSITHDAKTLYFSSDRPGGFGGLDIYKSTKNEKGEWTEPINLGANINTQYDEDSPFIHNEDVLYFSSQGHSSMGGYDIFVSNLVNGDWEKPHNLGYPINTADDDIYFVVSADNKRGYYASAKAGGLGDKDLYMVRLPELEYVKTNKPNTNIIVQTPNINIENKPNQEKKFISLLKGTITDAKTKELLSADIVLTDLADNVVEEELNSQEPLGKYQTLIRADKRYLISVEKQGYLFHSEDFVVPPQPQKDQEIIVDIALYKLQKGERINLKVFYDFDKDFLRPESVTELERLVAFLEKYPTLQVEIAGHTDAIGTDTKNQGLSERRATSVVRYLIERGINPKRLIAKGYGESKPIASNDNEEGRQLNRRTECVVVAF